MPADDLARVAPELRAFVAGFQTLALTRAGLADLRADLDEQIRRGAPGCPDGVVREERRVPGPAGAPAVRLLVYRPKALGPNGAAYLHIHGGGYMLGLPEMNEARNAALAQALGVVVASVDYRRAPDHPHPAPLEDCYAALTWLAAGGEDLRLDPGRIAVGGESAGGGLAANLALAARDRGDVRPVLQALIYPMLDDRTGSVRRAPPQTVEFVWPAASNRLGWASLLGREPRRVSAPRYAAAARAKTLAGLAPTFIAVGGVDILRDEGLDYALRLSRSGVATELRLYPGAIHGFDLAAETRLARMLVADLHAALRTAFAVPADPVVARPD
jgi:acetyl esterase/lipase